MTQERSQEDISSHIALHASVLSFAEIGLGSLLHASHIPFRGQVLSLNQIFLLVRVSKISPRKRNDFSPLLISAIAASIKSLSPMGKKITPMLALFMQGLLFNCGTALLGNRLAGQLLGAFLSSLWAFIQPLLLYALIFGKGLFNAIAYVSHLTLFSERLLIWGLISFLLLKAIAAISVAFISASLPSIRAHNYFTKIMHTASKLSGFKVENSKYSRRKNAWLSFKDLFKPFFIISVCLSLAFYYFGVKSENYFLHGVIRPLVTGFIGFFIIRELSRMNFFEKFKKVKSPAFQKGLSKVYQQIKKSRSDGI